MAEYHVGCGIAGIYAGRLDKSGERWAAKSLVTDEVVSAAAQYLLQNDLVMEFDCREKHYRIAVEEVKK